MKIKKFIPKMAFAIAILGLSLSVNGLQRILDYILAGILTLAALILLLEKKITKPWWRQLVRQAEALDITYVAFGLGLLLTGTKFLSTRWGWGGFILCLVGAIFAGLGTGKLINKSANDILKTPKYGIIVGFAIVIFSIILSIVTWNSILINWQNATTPVLLFIIGVRLIFVGFKKRKKKRITRKPNSRQKPLV